MHAKYSHPFSLRRAALTLALLCLPLRTLANNHILNIYTWSDYIPPAIVKQFERETHITVYVNTYNGNEMLYARLKADPKLQYDIIMPSSNYVDRFRRNNLIQKFDQKKLSHALIQHIDTHFMHRAFDPNNAYSLPYLWGATGIAANHKYHKFQQPITWHRLWGKHFRHQLLLLDDYREVFAIALIALGYSVNDTNPTHIKAAYEKLQALIPNIKAFNSDAISSMYADGDITLGIGWTGGVLLAQQDNPQIRFYYPYPHYMLTLDCIAIPKHAPHLSSAYRFINFVNRPKIAAAIAAYSGFSTPNRAAMKLLPKALQHNPLMNPDAKTLARAEFQSPLGNAAKLYRHYWSLLKL